VKPLITNLFTKVIWRLSILLILLVVAAVPAFPATTASGLSRLVERLQDHYQATDSFTAKFVETLESPGAPPRDRSGQVSYRKPGMIRWEFGAPQPETIVADGTTLFDYDPGLNQVVEMPLKNAFKGRSAVAFILGVGNLRRDFSVASTASGSDDGLKHLTVSPKDGGDKIELGLDTKTMNILKLRVIDGLGNSTTLQFSSITRNVAIDRAQFKFVAPEGADIVNAAPSS
jgi:outer membrane lipoprotein carrier protein